jgi:hypothetical protein
MYRYHYGVGEGESKDSCFTFEFINLRQKDGWKIKNQKSNHSTRISFGICMCVKELRCSQRHVR